MNIDTLIQIKSSSKRPVDGLLMVNSEGKMAIPKWVFRKVIKKITNFYVTIAKENNKTVLYFALRKPTTKAYTVKVSNFDNLDVSKVSLGKVMNYAKIPFREGKHYFSTTFQYEHGDNVPVLRLELGGMRRQFTKYSEVVTTTN